jgi:1-acyl-sn-glycerol-3-phosphate acyltransferase
MNYRWISSFFLSFVFLIFFSISSAILFWGACVIRLVTAPFDRRRILLNLFSSFWASLYTWCMPLWSVKITGREKLSMKKNYVLVSNHQSQLDILVLYRLFFPFIWVSKAEVVYLPFIGWNMVLNGYIKLRRGDKASARQVMQVCEALLNQNISVFFFPEGTRSRDGKLKPFKPGAFILAKKTRVPIVPLVINFTKDVLPKHSLLIRGCHCMEVAVLDEIPVASFIHLEVDEIAQMVRARINACIKSAPALDTPCQPPLVNP